MYNKHKYNAKVYPGVRLVLLTDPALSSGVGMSHATSISLKRKYIWVLALLVREETLRARQKGEETLKASVKKP